MGKKLYVGNLPYSATDQSLHDTFSQVGTVTTPAVGVVNRAAARDDLRRIRIALLRRKAGDPAPRLRPETHAGSQHKKEHDGDLRLATSDLRLATHHVHHASTAGSVRIARDSTSIAAFSPSSIEASASSCSMLIT